jgi:hypothetical protein
MDLRIFSSQSTGLMTYFLQMDNWLQKILYTLLQEDFLEIDDSFVQWLLVDDIFYRSIYNIYITIGVVFEYFFQPCNAGFVSLGGFQPPKVSGLE